MILLTLRPSQFLATLFGILLLLFAAMLVHAHWPTAAQEAALVARSKLVQRLGLTDLALFTEARYSRHLSMADLHSAFQDHPMSLDHFPTGSLVPPPVTFDGRARFASSPVRERKK